ncbi:MAG: oligosaccharide flippase family protein [Sphingomonadales bacterium]|nr:oligosaccharide flippase family protein [Sphingomonadales bacterium]
MYALAKGVPGVLGLLSVVIFVRLVGPEQFGLYAIMAATISMWATFASGWFCQGIVRYYSSWHASYRELHRFLAKGIGVSIAIYSVALLINFASLDNLFSWIEFGLSFALGALIISQSITISCALSDLQPNVVLRVEMIRAIVSFGVTCAIAYYVSATAASLLAGAGIGYAFSLLGYRSPALILEPKTQSEKPGLAQAWIYGWPLSFWFLAQLSFAWLDRIMIQAQFGLHDTGVFASLSEIFTRGFSLLIYPITIAAHPRLTAMWNAGDKKGSWHLLKIAVSLGVGASLIAVIVLHFTQGMLLRFILPTEAATLPHAQPFLVAALTTGGAIWQLALLMHKPLELQSRTKIMLLAIIAAFGVKLVTNRFGLAHFGVSGAAYGTILSGLVYMTLCALSTRSGKSTP